jgi:hypothetical protein
MDPGIAVLELTTLRPAKSSVTCLRLRQAVRTDYEADREGQKVGSTAEFAHLESALSNWKWQTRRAMTENR